MRFGAALAGSPESFMNDVNAIGFDCPSHLARLEAEGEFLYCPEGERTLIALDLRGVFCVYGGNGVEVRGMRGIGEVLSDSK